MELGFASAILPDLSFEKVIDFAAKCGYKCVEMMCWPVEKASRRYAGVTHIDVTDFGESDATRYKAYAANQGIDISALGYYPNPMDASEEKASYYIDHLKKLIQAAPLLGVGRVNTFIGRDQSLDEEQNLEKFAKVWPDIIRFAGEHGVNICIENCPMYFTYDEWPKGQNLAYSPAIWNRMFEIIPDENFGLNYDPSHLLWMHMDYIKPIYQFKDRMLHIHIKDAKLLKDKLDQVGILANPLEFHSPKLPGLGDIDWGKFFSALTDIRYEGYVCVEVEDKAYEKNLDSRLRALRQSYSYLNQYVV